jgi:hypothetical protein
MKKKVTSQLRKIVGKYDTLTSKENLNACPTMAPLPGLICLMWQYNNGGEVVLCP